MATIKCKRDFQNATDEEIKNFLKSATFKGNFVASNIDARFCGKLENISLNGEVNDFCPSNLIVPVKFVHFVKEGSCEFTASLNLKEFKSERHLYSRSLKIFSFTDIQ